MNDRIRENFPRNLVPVIDIDGRECELVTRGGPDPEGRTRMRDLAQFLGHLSGEEWNELQKLGAFKGAEGALTLAQSKIDCTMRTLLQVSSEREWKEEGFSLDDLHNAAEFAVDAALAHRRSFRALPVLESRLAQLEDKASEIEQKKLEIDELRDELRAELERVEEAYKIAARPDDPSLDATDGAHPAWWRGCEHGVLQTCKGLTKLLTAGFQVTPSFTSSEMNTLGVEILTLYRTVATIGDILTDLRVSTILDQHKPSYLTDEMWEDLNGIHKRLISG